MQEKLSMTRVMVTDRLNYDVDYCTEVPVSLYNS